MATLWTTSGNCTWGDNPNVSSWLQGDCDVYDEETHEPNLWCLLLILFPLTCLFGNSLVVLAVLTERSLQTSTNYLLVSLAVADMLVASIVMPFAVYLTVNRLHWFLPDGVCNFFCVADVSASTASIVHLVSISIDRFYAVVRHMEYKTSRHRSRIYGTILFCWLFSIAIGLPLGIGLNQNDGDATHRCGIVNPNYMFYSSIFAFYIPCLVMIVMYSFVFFQLHKRLRAVKLQEMAAAQMVNFGDNLGKILETAIGDTNAMRRNTMNWAAPFIKTIEETIANMAENEDVSTDEIDELTTILHTLESDPQLMFNGLQSNNNKGLVRQNSDDTTEDLEHTNSSGAAGPRKKRRFSHSLGNVGKRSSIFVAKQKIKTLKNRALELIMRVKSKQGMAIRKETRATKLVATVMLVFLLCYMPFFTTNIVKVFKLWYETWTEDLEQAFIVFTWFGYLNSCLNPVIYSLFNRKFRATFKKLLHCQSKKELRSSQHGNRRFYDKPYAGSTKSKDSGLSTFAPTDDRMTVLKFARAQMKKEKTMRKISTKLKFSGLMAVPEHEDEHLENNTEDMSHSNRHLIVASEISSGDDAQFVSVMAPNEQIITEDEEPETTVCVETSKAKRSTSNSNVNQSISHSNSLQNCQSEKFDSPNSTISANQGMSCDQINGEFYDTSEILV